MSRALARLLRTWAETLDPRPSPLLARLEPYTTSTAPAGSVTYLIGGNDGQEG